MSTVVLVPTYFASIDVLSKLKHAEKIIFEVSDNYQKQTLRTRQYIYGANGKLLLNIPIKHQKGVQKERQTMASVEIDNSFPWRSNHIKSLQSAYRTSPYFEYYEDEFEALYNASYTHLLEFNLACWKLLLELLDINAEVQHTNEYNSTFTDAEDLRPLSVAKRKPIVELPSYIQVFSPKYGYIPNLSVLDLLFNEGPNAVNLFA
jgi:hypothetical protein